MSLFKKTTPTASETDADTTARDQAAETANHEQELSTFDGRVSEAKAIPYGVQHVLAMFVANLAPIAIIAAAAGFDSTTSAMLVQNAMIIAAIGTAIQLFPVWRIGSGLPIVMGVSFTFVTVLCGIAATYGYGAVIGAFLAGRRASAWRSAVRHGLLAPHLGYPRICLTVPSIVIMVPGLYMYQAMFHLGQFDTLNALDWAFRAFMVIICLPIGLAMARVVTDKSWRYDI